VRQAEGALLLYLDRFKGGDRLKVLPDKERVGTDGASILNEMKRLIRVKHYSYSTERTYLDRAKRFYTHAMRNMANAPKSPLDTLLQNRE